MSRSRFYDKDSESAGVTSVAKSFLQLL